MNIQDSVRFVRELYHEPEAFIPLHIPRFRGKEKEYLLDCIDSTFVSSVGAYVNRFEEMMCELTGAKYAVAVVNGTNALQVAMRLAGVKSGDLVLTQALSFVATANAIAYLGAEPAFIDVDRERMGMSPEALESFLQSSCEKRPDGCFHKASGMRVSAVIPMHTFGFPVEIDKICAIAEEWGLPVVEDAAESIGSSYKGTHTGRFGKLGTFSFNGNKVVTCGGGGAIITDDEDLAKLGKHLTTTAKVPHRWDYEHDYLGYNFRMPNLNAALACAQLEQLDDFLKAKKEQAERYAEFFAGQEGIDFVSSPADSVSNYWLMAVILTNRDKRDQFLQATNGAGVMTRPVWKLLNTLPMYRDCLTDGLENSRWLEDRVVNIPSTVV